MIATSSVVLVDDTPDIRSIFRMALERRGAFDVVGEAGDGITGLEVARSLDPDIILLDILMPLQDGLTSLPGIREACPEATIILLSSFDPATYEPQVRDRGADGFIQKGRPVAHLAGQVAELHARASACRAGRAGR